MQRFLLALAAALAAPASGFSLLAAAPSAATASRRSALRPTMQQWGGNVEELEFIIHPDGRVEERVRGIKGKNCQSVTAEIEEALGEVYETKATEEMFEEQNYAMNSAELEAEVKADGPPEW